MFSSPMSGLAHGRLRTVDGLGDFGVAEVEHLLEHEHRALERAERLQHDEHRHRHRFGRGDVVGGVGGGQDGLRKPRPHIGFPLMPGGPQPLHRQIGCDPGQIGLRVGDLSAVGRRPSQP
jgi:hypothetical protein